MGTAGPRLKGECPLSGRSDAPANLASELWNDLNSSVRAWYTNDYIQWHPSIPEGQRQVGGYALRGVVEHSQNIAKNDLYPIHIKIERN